MGLRLGRVAWLAAVLLVAGQVNVQGEGIPPVRCSNLAGEAVRLPEDLRGRTAVLVMGFSRESQSEVREWGTRLATAYGGSAGVAYYEVAMLGGAPRLVRPLIVRSMKKEMTAGVQAHFLAMTDDEAAWRLIAHYEKPDAAYVVVVDGGGNVVWRTTGGATEAAWGDLRGHVGR